MPLEFSLGFYWYKEASKPASPARALVSQPTPVHATAVSPRDKSHRRGSHACVGYVSRKGQDPKTTRRRLQFLV